MSYRGDIDGLRAIAVAAVIGFHYGVPGLDGGSLGVDVFFVISGYLITRLLMAEVGQGRLDLLKFYRRRTIRILPALLAMILIICALGLLILLNVEARTLAISGITASLFSSNFYFWRKGGYFGSIADAPLLHTWSLGVEEQFYILYPIVLWALHRLFGARLGASLWIGSAVALGLYCALSSSYPGAAFFMAPARAWQLGLGGAIAVGVPILKSHRANSVATLIGLALIIYAIAMGSKTEGMLFNRIAVSAGTGLLLAYGRDSATKWLLALAPLQWLGRLSYSLYLWHFPLLQLYLGGIDPEPTPLAMTGVFALSFGAALLSYYLIELPIRQRYRKAGGSRGIVLVGVTAAAVSAALCLIIATFAASLRPLPEPVDRIASYLNYRNSVQFNYQFGPRNCRDRSRDYEMDRCLHIVPEKRNVIVFGDSHAAHIWRAIVERFSQDNVLLVSKPGCLPLYSVPGRPQCRNMVDQARQLIESGKIQSVVLAAAWEAHDYPAIGDTIRSIRGRGISVTVLGPVARYDLDFPRLLAFSMMGNENFHRVLLRRSVSAEIDRKIGPLAAQAGATYYSLYDHECPNDRCLALTRNGVPFHFDLNHITLDAARELISTMPAT